MTAAAARPSSPSWLSALADEPALVVVLLASVALLIAGTILLRLRRVVRQARTRAALEDWLLGAEDALCAQWRSARERLQRVVALDPENHGARLLLGEALLALDEPAAAHSHFVALTEAFGVRSPRVERGLVQALRDSDRVAEAAERVRVRGRVEQAAAVRHRPHQPAAGHAVAVAPGRPQPPLPMPLALVAAAPASGPTPPGTALARGRTAAELALHEIAAEVAAAPFACSRCGVALAHSVVRCPQCEAKNTAAVREPGLQRALVSVAAAADEIEENDAYLRRLLAQTLAGDDAARAALTAAGAPAVDVVFTHAVAHAGPRALLVEVMQAMGSPALAALFDAYERVRRQSAHGPAADAAPDVVGRVVQTYGPSALPAFEARLDTEDHDLRKIVIDYYLGLEQVEELQAVLERYPPVEVIQRLNATPAPRLQRWLTRVPDRGLLAEVVLVHPMFLRDEDLLLAAAQADAPDALLAILRRRSATHDLATFAVDHLHDDAVAPVAERLLQHYGLAAVDALLAGTLDLDRAQQARVRARGLLVQLGAPVVAQVCQCFGPSPSRLDDELVALLVAIGDVAVEPLCDAYRKRNLMERVAGRLVRRYNHPRNAIVKVLARIGGPAARSGLLTLRSTESDANLKLRLDQALQVVTRAPALTADGAQAGGRDDARQENVG
jgi:hypothetical protein